MDAQRANIAGGCLKAFARATANRNMRTLTCQGERNASTDATAPAGNQRNLVCQLEVYSCSPSATF